MNTPGFFSRSSDFCQVPVSLREDTTWSQMHTEDLWNLVLRCTHFSCTVSHFCASERKLQLTFTFTHSCAGAQDGVGMRRDTSFRLLQFVICHMSHPDPMMTTCDDLWKWHLKCRMQSEQGAGGHDRAGGERHRGRRESQREAAQRSVLKRATNGSERTRGSLRPSVKRVFFVNFEKTFEENFEKNLRKTK